MLWTSESIHSCFVITLPLSGLASVSDYIYTDTKLFFFQIFLYCILLHLYPSSHYSHISDYYLFKNINVLIFFENPQSHPNIVPILIEELY